MMRQQDVKGKPRGGASHACPKCSSRTEVVDTRRQEDGLGVRRFRLCTNRQCLHKFETVEKAMKRGRR
jgi:transcriptional regulator NrdR family protein